MADRRIVQCITAFHVAGESSTVLINAGDLYFADDPILKGREHFFDDAKVKSSAAAPKRTAVSSSATEEATATPGRRRSLSRRDDKPELETKPEVKDEKGGEV